MLQKFNKKTFLNDKEFSLNKVYPWVLEKVNLNNTKDDQYVVIEARCDYSNKLYNGVFKVKCYNTGIVVKKIELYNVNTILHYKLNLVITGGFGDRMPLILDLKQGDRGWINLIDNFVKNVLTK